MLVFASSTDDIGDTIAHTNGVIVHITTATVTQSSKKSKISGILI